MSINCTVQECFMFVMQITTSCQLMIDWEFRPKSDAKITEGIAFRVSKPIKFSRLDLTSDCFFD